MTTTAKARPAQPSRHPVYRFISAMNDDGYDHGTDGTLPNNAHRWPALAILALRPGYSAGLFARVVRELRAMGYANRFAVVDGAHITLNAYRAGVRKFRESFRKGRGAR